MSFSCFVRRETRYHTHAHTYGEWKKERESGRESLTHAQLTCYPRQVCGKWNNLSGERGRRRCQGKVTRMTQNKTAIKSTRPTSSANRERAGKRKRRRERHTHTHTHKHLVDCWNRKRQSRAGKANAGGRRWRWRREREVKICVLVCILSLSLSHSCPLPPSPLTSFFRSAFKFALLLQICLITVFFLIFFLHSRLLWRRARTANYAVSIYLHPVGILLEKREFIRLANQLKTCEGCCVLC